MGIGRIDRRSRTNKSESHDSMLPRGSSSGLEELFHSR